MLVYPGTYVENVDFNGKSLVFGSKFLTTGDSSYISSTIIDGNQSGYTVFVDYADDPVTISGFTIRNGSGPGAGLRIEYSEMVTIDHCHITENQWYGGNPGAGMFIMYSDFIIQNSEIYDNITSSGGGALMCYASIGTFRNCKIYNLSLIHI